MRTSSSESGSNRSMPRTARTIRSRASSAGAAAAGGRVSTTLLTGYGMSIPARRRWYQARR